MRNSYVQAAKCFFRFRPFGVTLIFVLLMTMPGFANDFSESQPFERKPEHSFWGTTTLFLGAMVSSFFSEHLKQMLGGPNGRLIPGVQRPHLTIVTLFSVMISALVMLPLMRLGAERWLFGTIAMLTVLAVCLSSSFDAPIRMISVFAIAFIIGLYRSDLMEWIWPKSLLGAFAWLTIATAAFIRLWRHAIVPRSDFSEAYLWEPPIVEWKRLHAQLPAQESALSAIAELIPYHREFRTQRKSGSIGREGVLHRARRWNLVWQSVLTAILFGSLILGAQVLLAFSKHVGFSWLVFTIESPFLVFFPVLWILNDHQMYLSLELLRPDSRSDYLCGVGAALAISCLAYWILVAGVGSLVVLVTSALRGMDDPMSALMRLLLISTCTVPLVFGLAIKLAADFRSHWFILIFWGIAGSLGLMCWINAVIVRTTVEWERMSAISLTSVCILLVAAGSAAIYWAYRSWLNLEVTHA